MIRHAHIIHGYQSAPERHWFPWLAEKLAGQGIVCTRIALPDAGRPDFGRWQQSLAEHIGQADEHHLLIAHSLGTHAAALSEPHCARAHRRHHSGRGF